MDDTLQVVPIDDRNTWSVKKNKSKTKHQKIDIQESQHIPHVLPSLKNPCFLDP